MKKEKENQHRKDGVNRVSSPWDLPCAERRFLFSLNKGHSINAIASYGRSI